MNLLHSTNFTAKQQQILHSVLLKCQGVTSESHKEITFCVAAGGIGIEQFSLVLGLETSGFNSDWWKR